MDHRENKTLIVNSAYGLVLSSYAVMFTLHRAAIGTLDEESSVLEAYATYRGLLDTLHNMNDYCKPGLWLSCEFSTQHVRDTITQLSQTVKVISR